MEVVAAAVRDTEEALFSFHLLLQDANNLRTVIWESWAGYKIGGCDLVSASLTTNAAIDLVRCFEEEIKSLLDKFGGSATLLQGIFHLKGEDEDFKEQPGDDLNFRMYDDTDDLFYTTWQLLAAFLNVIEPGYYWTYRPESNRSTKSPREQFQEDKQILTKIFTEFAISALAATGRPRRTR